MADETELILASALTIVVLVLGWFLGRWFDADWRCNFLRRLTKKNYIVVNVTDKDGHNLLSTVCNATDDTVTIGTDMWVLTRGKIYSKKNISKGFLIQDSDIKFRNGAPNIFVDKETVTPVDFYSTTDEIIKPAEIGATLQAWIANQLAKALSNINRVNLILHLIIALLLGNLIIGWLNGQEIGAIRQEVKNLQSAIAPVIPAGTKGVVQNGTLYIDQTKGGASGK